MKRFSVPIAFAMVLFSLLPIPVGAAELLIPVGAIIGLQLSDDTVTVAAFDDAAGTVARDAGLKIGDEIVTMDGLTIDCAEDVRSALSDCRSQIALTIRRDGKLQTLRLTPEDTADGPRLGIYLRQGITGIGTVTFYDPETGVFGTLGHSVSNSKGSLLQLKEGSAFKARVESVKKGKSGDPGQLKGSADDANTIGTLFRNTPQGVFGVTNRGWSGKAFPIADFEEIHTGNASIRCTVMGTVPRNYSVEILKIYPEDRPDHRNFLIRVTDPELLAATGGIVQGMSGSPICQDGKIIGAVTHVLVNDPTTGYGIYIENMLDAAG